MQIQSQNAPVIMPENFSVSLKETANTPKMIARSAVEAEVNEAQFNDFVQAHTDVAGEIVAVEPTPAYEAPRSQELQFDPNQAFDVNNFNLGNPQQDIPRYTGIKEKITSPVERKTSAELRVPRNVYTWAETLGQDIRRMRDAA